MSTPFLDFFKNAGTGTVVNIGTAQSRGAQDSIAGSAERISDKTISSPSFQNAARTFQNILAGGELPETFRESVTTNNLLALGESQKTLSSALNDQITIREEQRQETFGAISGLANIVAEINNRLSGQVQQLGQSVTDASQAANQAQSTAEQQNFLESLTTGLGVSLPVLAAIVGGILILK